MRSMKMLPNEVGAEVHGRSEHILNLIQLRAKGDVSLLRGRWEVAKASLCERVLCISETADRRVGRAAWINIVAAAVTIGHHSEITLYSTWRGLSCLLSRALTFGESCSPYSHGKCPSDHYASYDIACPWEGDPCCFRKDWWAFHRPINSWFVMLLVPGCQSSGQELVHKNSWNWHSSQPSNAT